MEGQVTLEDHHDKNSGGSHVRRAIPWSLKRRSLGLHEALLTKKHAMVYAKLLKDYEEIKGAENDTSEEGDGRDHQWKNKIGEILSLMMEMIGRSAEQKMKGSPEATEHDVSQSQRGKKKADGAQETLEHDLFGPQRSKRMRTAGRTKERITRRRPGRMNG